MSRALLFKIGAAALPAVLFLHGCRKQSNTHKASKTILPTEELPHKDLPIKPPHKDLATIQLVAERYNEIHQVS